LLGLPLLALVVLIAVQAFVAAQVGMRLGSMLAERWRQAAERFAGALLLVAATLVLVERLVPI
jgi:putative Mn2+ efflux pump MntP